MISILLLYAAGSGNRTLSYQLGWPKHFRIHRRFRCTPINVLSLSRLQRTLIRGFSSDRLRRIANIDFLLSKRYDAVVVLHSVFSNSYKLPGVFFKIVRRIQVPKAYFIGNEYKLMPEKMDFCEQLGVNLLVSMTANHEVHSLYRQRLGCKVVNIPSAGLDTELFFPEVDYSDRPIDIGFRAYGEPLYFGHQDRKRMVDYFHNHAERYGLRVDISLGEHEKRFTPAGYANFLNQCKGQIATEGGTDYFELTDQTRKRVNAYMQDNFQASLSEIQDSFLNYSNPISARMISGRHVEAAGTKTVQILFEGYYNGYFQPDVHYIPLKKDFSNIDEVIAKFRDEGYCQRITENAYNVAVQELTYEKLIDRFYEALVPLL